MSRHFRDFPGASFDHWLTTDPNDDFLGPDPHIEDDEPELVECEGCGDEFEPDHDNQFHASNGSVVFYCDRCLRLGAAERVRK